MTEYVLAKPVEPKEIVEWLSSVTWTDKGLIDFRLKELFVPLKDKKQQIRELMEKQLFAGQEVYKRTLTRTHLPSQEQTLKHREDLDKSLDAFVDRLVSLIYGEQK